MKSLDATVAPENEAYTEEEAIELAISLDTIEKAEAWVKQATPKQIAYMKEMKNNIVKLHDAFEALSEDEKKLVLEEN